MRENVCPRCTAVAAPAGDFRICPNCGYDGVKPFSKVSLATFHYLPPLLIFVAGLAPILSIFFDVELKYWMIVAVVLLAGAAWTSVARRFRREYDDPTAALNIYAKKKSDGQSREQVPMTALRMPETPRTWKPLMATSRPRQVYLPFSAKFSLWSSAIFVPAVSVGLWWASSHHRGAFAHGITWQRGWAPLLNLLGFGLGTFLMIWRETSSRRLLREGEATIGYWHEGGYQFWSQSGQAFRQASSIVQPSAGPIGIGLIPVFYSPNNPANSVALCSVYSKIRIPAEATFVATAGLTTRF
jgi:hypothetical protein